MCDGTTIINIKLFRENCQGSCFAYKYHMLHIYMCIWIRFLCFWRWLLFLGEALCRLCLMVRFGRSSFRPNLGGTGLVTFRATLSPPGYRVLNPLKWSFVILSRITFRILFANVNAGFEIDRWISSNVKKYQGPPNGNFRNQLCRLFSRFTVEIDLSSQLYLLFI